MRGERGAKPKVMLVLPELAEGGVERHVLTLARGLCELGFGLLVVSAGGPLVSELPQGVRHVEMPVDRKTPLTGVPCARKLAALAVSEDIELIHAHSRVPAWIALLARNMAGLKFVFTAHARYSLNYGLLPLRYADGAICVSQTVRDHLAQWLPKNVPVEVICNALPESVVPWTGSGDERRHLLYLGRLTPKKGPMTLVDAVSRTGADNWVLDIVGDGPMRGELEERVSELDLEDRVIFHGHSDVAARWISKCDLFLFPSQDEGMGLSLAEALAAGAPALASDIPAVRELVASEGGAPSAGLLPPGDADAWASAIRGFLDDTFRPGLKCGIDIPTAQGMASQTSSLYVKLLR